MTSYRSGWLWLAFGTELGELETFSAAPAAQAAVVLLADGLDGARWLATAPFDTIMYSVLLRNNAAEPHSFRIRRRELEIDTYLDARSMPSDPSWWFLKQAQHVLNAVAEHYHLGAPPLRQPLEERGPSTPPQDVLPPVDQDADADIGADLDALEEDELLVVIPYRLPGEDEDALFRRRLHVDDLLTDVLGAPPNASSATGNAYVFTFPMPRARRRRGRERRG